MKHTVVASECARSLHDGKITAAERRIWRCKRCRPTARPLHFGSIGPGRIAPHRQSTIDRPSREACSIDQSSNGWPWGCTCLNHSNRSEMRCRSPMILSDPPSFFLPHKHAHSTHPNQPTRPKSWRTRRRLTSGRRPTAGRRRTWATTSTPSASPARSPSRAPPRATRWRSSTSVFTHAHTPHMHRVSVVPRGIYPRCDVSIRIYKNTKTTQINPNPTPLGTTTPRRWCTGRR